MEKPILEKEETIINKIKEIAFNEGIYDIGFSKNLENESNLPYALSLVVHLSEALVDEIQGEPTMSYFHHYRTVNYFIDQLQLKIGNYLQNMGYKYIPIPASQSISTSPTAFSGRFSHKTAAVRSGLGYIGKNCLFLHKKLGARVRLGTILTNLNLENYCLENPPKEGILSPLCENCNKCIDACPGKALIGKKSTSAKRELLLKPEVCSQFMKSAYQHIGRGAVCGVCMQVCPANKLN